MKKKYIIGIIVGVGAVAVTAFTSLKSTTPPDYIAPPNEDIPLVVIPDTSPLDDVETVFTSTIENENFTSQSENPIGEILVKSSIDIPKSNYDTEFSENFNEYYTKILEKAQAYKNYEGADLAEFEYEYFKEDFTPINYLMNFDILFEDENLISIKREVEIHSNEKDFFNIYTETFNKDDGALILITDICSNILQIVKENHEIEITSFEDFNFCLTSNGIWCASSNFEMIVPYDMVDFDEKYAYLGELNVTD